jgi:hypothetical protein
VPEKANLIHKVISDILTSFQDSILTIFGIGSYFDELLPKEWEKNDLDLVVVVKNYENTPKPKWGKIRFTQNQIDGIKVWSFFYTLETLQSKESYEPQSLANYEWSIIELNYPENSKIVYGKNIRSHLPVITHDQFDFDDILARGLYHLNNSYQMEEVPLARMEFSKAGIKICFYLCLLRDPYFHYTSPILISQKIQELVQQNKLDSVFVRFLEEIMVFRISGSYKSEFSELRTSFFSQLVLLAHNEKLHREFDLFDLHSYLKNQYKGFRELRVQLNELFNKERT